MKELQNILDKIEQETAKKIEELKKEAEEKKQQIQHKYQKILEEKKHELDKKFSGELELEKKRFYTEQFINYNKEIEKVKNHLFTILLSEVKKSILNLDKQKYYALIKSILTKNIFFGEPNLVIFDKSNKLTKNDQQNLIAEVLSEVTKINKNTKLEISKDGDLDFGVKIVAGKKSKEYKLDEIIEVIKPEIEKKINDILAEADV